jgi:hypothetical protein
MSATSSPASGIDKPRKKTQVKYKKKRQLSMPNVWSFSRWSTYSQCPLKAKLTYIDGYRFEREKGSASDRGVEVHALAQNWLESPKLKKLPPIFDFFKEDLHRLRRLRAVAEVPLAFRRDWTPCDFDAPDYWWHGELDAVAMLSSKVALVVDYKTGKEYEHHVLQLELYALAVMLTDKSIRRVIVEDWYIDLHRKSRRREYTRSQIPMLKKIWERRTKAMFNDHEFAPLPGFLCSWCDFTKSKGSGLCAH